MWWGGWCLIQPTTMSFSTQVEVELGSMFQYSAFHFLGRPPTNYNKSIVVIGAKDWIQNIKQGIKMPLPLEEPMVYPMPGKANDIADGTAKGIAIAKPMA